MLYFILNMNVDDVAVIDPARNENFQQFGISGPQISSNSIGSTAATLADPVSRDTRPIKISSITNETTKKKYDVIRNRIKFVGKMMLMMKTLREQNETVIKVK